MGSGQDSIEKGRDAAYHEGKRENGAGMLSAGEILLLNQLLYCPKEEDEKTTIHAYQGNTIGVLLNRWSAEPLPDEADCGLCMKGKEWNHIVRLIAENPDLRRMMIQSVHWDEAAGGGGGMSVVFTGRCLREAVVVFRGTAAGEWRDDFLGGAATGERDGVSTTQQRNALEWYRSLGLSGHFSRITVSGHSKGGNKAKYIALMEDSVTRCVSFDGQGFSDEFIEKYRDRICVRQQVIENHNMEYDYVNILLNDVGKKFYYQGFADKRRGILRMHCINAFFWFGEGDSCFLVRGEKEEEGKMQVLDRFLNSCLRSLSREKKIDMTEFLGAMAELELGAESEEPFVIEDDQKDSSGKKNRQNAMVSLLLQGKNLDLTAYLLAYLMEYQRTVPEWMDSIEQVSEKFGLRGLKLLTQIAKGMSEWNDLEIWIKGIGILMDAAPDWMWERLQSLCEERCGWGISEGDLRRLAGIVNRAAEMGKNISVRPGTGEDLNYCKSSLQGTGQGR